MEPHERCWARLPLEGAFNVRELGGYPTYNGGFTQYHRFLRSDCLCRLTAWDVRFLRDYGVRAVIDLRDEDEAANTPNVSLGPDVVTTNIPLMEFNASEIKEIERRFAAGTFAMEDIYRHILEHYEGMRAVMRFIAEAPEGCVLFNCAVGKDRTGILSMLLLGLAGVDKWDIVANYMQTWPNLMRDDVFYADWMDASHNAYREAMNSLPRYIEYAYDLLEDTHGGIESYLLECGVRDEDVAIVRQRMLLE